MGKVLRMGLEWRKNKIGNYIADLDKTTIAFNWDRDKEGTFYWLCLTEDSDETRYYFVGYTPDCKLEYMRPKKESKKKFKGLLALLNNSTGLPRNRRKVLDIIIRRIEES